MKRYITAIDNNGVYFRETLNVTHDASTGEVIYHTKPIKRVPKKSNRREMERVLKGATKKFLVSLALDYREGYFRMIELLLEERKTKTKGGE